jgi:hypothetical protein
MTNKDGGLMTFLPGDTMTEHVTITASDDGGRAAPFRRSKPCGYACPKYGSTSTGILLV